MAPAQETPPVAPGAAPPHVPVLLRPLLAAVAPVRGIWIDGTFGAGSYARGLLEAGAERVIGIDRDPLAFELSRDWTGHWGERLTLVDANFATLDRVAAEVVSDSGAGSDTGAGSESGAASGTGVVSGVVLDLGVSSMQLDRAERGFSFRHDGPLDMRMAQRGSSAADLVNGADEAALADILFHYGEERAARRIARAIVAARRVAPIVTTAQLAAVVERCLPRAKPGQSHPATRSFQAIRIAVNDELGALVAGLEAAERALVPGGWLAVVTFHSIEDRIVKRFMQIRAGEGGRANRHAPQTAPAEAPGFALYRRGAIAPDATELAANPRARSARLRLARRSDTPAGAVARERLGLPPIVGDGAGRTGKGG